MDVPDPWSPSTGETFHPGGAALTPDLLIRLAGARLTDADVLLANRRRDGAYYLAGYSVELALKWRICKTLCWGEYPTGKKYGSFRTHDLDLLLSFSGFEQVWRQDGFFLTHWSVVRKWNPDFRYVGLPADQQEVGTLMVASCREVVAYIQRRHEPAFP